MSDIDKLLQRTAQGVAPKRQPEDPKAVAERLSEAVTSGGIGTSRPLPMSSIPTMAVMGQQRQPILEPDSPVIQDLQRFMPGAIEADDEPDEPKKKKDQDDKDEPEGDDKGQPAPRQTVRMQHQTAPAPAPKKREVDPKATKKIINRIKDIPRVKREGYCLTDATGRSYFVEARRPAPIEEAPKTSAFRIGDRVKWSRKWLRSTGQFSGSVPHGVGVVKHIGSLGSKQLLTIKWDYADEEFKALAANVIHADRTHLEPN